MHTADVHGAFTHETAEDAFSTVLTEVAQHHIEFSLDRRGLPRQQMTASGRFDPVESGQSRPEADLSNVPRLLRNWIPKPIPCRRGDGSSEMPAGDEIHCPDAGGAAW